MAAKKVFLNSLLGIGIEILYTLFIMLAAFIICLALTK